MHDQQSVIGVYFSNGQRDSDEEPHFVNRLIKGIAANANGFCLVLQVGSPHTINIVDLIRIFRIMMFS